MSDMNRFDAHTKELLFQTLELLRREVQPKFSEWKGADDWLFSELDFTKAELQQIYDGHDDVMVYLGSAKDSSELPKTEPAKMRMLCEEFENDDGIREFTVLAVSEDEKMLQKLLEAKVEKDEYGFIAKNGGEYSSPNHYCTEFDGGFVEYYVLEQDVLFKEDIHKLLQSEEYEKVHHYPENLPEMMQDIIQEYAGRAGYGKIDAGKVVDALLNDDKFYAICILDQWWARQQFLKPTDRRFVDYDVLYYLRDVLLEQNPHFLVDCGAVPKVKYPEGLKDLLVDLIYDLAKEQRKPSISQNAEDNAERYMFNADFAKGIDGMMAYQKERGLSCDVEDLGPFCKTFVRSQLAPEKPSLASQIKDAQARTDDVQNNPSPEHER